MRKQILCILLCTLCALLFRTSLLADYMFVASGEGGSSDTNTVTVTLDTTGADFIAICAAGTDFGTLNNPTDLIGGNSNTILGLTEIQNATSGRIAQIHYIVNPAFTGASHAFTLTDTGAGPSLVVMAFSGSDTSSPFDKESTAADDSAPWQAGPITPVADALTVACMSSSENTNVLTITESLTTDASLQTLSDANHAGVFAAYKLVSAASAINPGWDNGAGGCFCANAVASFKEASAGTSAPKPSMLLRGVN